MIKAYFLSLLSFLCISFNGVGQDLSYGPEIGPNIIWLAEDYTGHYYTMGWHTGGFVEYGLNEFLSIRSGVYYTEKKQQYSVDDVSINPIIALLGFDGLDQIDLNTYTNTSGRVTQNYFEIPVIARLKYKGFGLSAGLQTSFMFRATTRQVVTENTPLFSIIDQQLFGGIGGLFIPPAEVITETTSQSKSGLNTFELGAKFGASYGVGNVELNAAFYLGFIDYTSSSSRARTHQYFQTTLSYNFAGDSGNGNFWQSKKLK